MLESIRKDYQDFLDEYGFTQEFVDSMLELPTLDDRGNGYPLELRESPIEGKGLFAINGFKNTEFIAMVRVNGARIFAGRYTNHSPTPNARFVLEESGDLSMEAVCDIAPGEEVTINYRQVGEVNGYKK